MFCRVKGTIAVCAVGEGTREGTRGKKGVESL